MKKKEFNVRVRMPVDVACGICAVKGEEIQFHRHGSLQLQGGAAYTLVRPGLATWYLRLWGAWQLLFYPGVGTACRCVRL